MNSGGMTETLNYKDGNVDACLVDTKGTSNQVFPKAMPKKEQWKPKAKAKWVEDKRQPLTLQ